ncbi:hypothetical protein V3C99_004593, partial [Haemonchus contortus]
VCVFPIHASAEGNPESRALPSSEDQGCR